jgi:hypothetical protein
MSDEPLHPTRAIERYSESPVFRALVTAIPYLGGSIDALFGQWGAEIAQRRFRVLLEELAKETARLDASKVDKAFLDSEEFVDLFTRAAREAARSRHREKVRLFARILAGRACVDWSGSTDAEEILDVLAGLSLRQISIMVRMWNRAHGHQLIEEVLPEHDERPFDYQRLVVMGLLSDRTPSVDHPGRLGQGYQMTDAFRTIMRAVEMQESTDPA